uniref:Uncharacterized protein n=1 Tax=Leersia perrieri TaxID=77586 RepID=A0A0D9XCR1_9ORYZ
MEGEALRMVFSREFWRMAILWTISLLYSYILLFFFRRGAPVPRRRRRRPRSDDNDGDDTGLGGRRPICVVTGATSGLGKAASAALAREGYHVVLAGRSSQLLSEVSFGALARCVMLSSTIFIIVVIFAKQTVQEIRSRQPDAHVEAFQVDLTSFKSIKKFEISLNQWIQDSNMEHSIQLLINNAGMLAKSQRITEDSFDEMMQANYIGPFVLTNTLLPLLKNSSTPSRVVNLTSFTHRCVCLLMFSYELHRQLHLSPGVSVMAADPGVVETGIMRELPPCLSWFALSVLRVLNLLQQPDTGVGAVLDAAFALPEASGKYFFGGKGRTISSSQLSYDIEVAKKLWAESLAVFNELQIGESELRTS